MYKRESRKVLFVAYHYPPAPAVGGLRPSKFVRYLPQFGWKPIVLTVARGNLAEDFVGSSTAEIHHVREWPHPLKAYEHFRMQRARKKGEADTLLAKVSVPHSIAIAPHSGDVRDVKSQLLAFLRLPDREMGWLVPAIWRGYRLIQANRIGHIVTTGPPFTCHLVGLALKRLTRVQWVADFRDPWSLEYKVQIFRNRATDFFEARLIRRVMTEADLILSVTPDMTDEIRKQHTEVDPSKCVTLTNGFDPEEFITLTQTRPSPRPIVFAYLGTFYGGRTPEPFLQALKSLIDDGAVAVCDIRVKFVGDVAVTEGQSVPEMVRRFGLEDIVSVNPPISRREALQQALETHVLLVLTEQDPHAYTFKLFDALASGAVILNVGSGGAVADLLLRTGRGIAVDHRNLNGVRNGILECIRRSRSEDTQRMPEPWADTAIQAYNFQYLTGRLADLLQGLDLRQTSVRP